jgi:hypothetical protein
MYCSYCKEIILRVVKGQDIEQATDAELLACFMELVTKTPVTSTAASAAYKLCMKVIPGNEFVKSLAFDNGMPVFREEYVGELDELIDQARKKYVRK